MKISGIICEYNPFHHGHAYLLSQAKEHGDAVVCVMSGNFVQRGEAAIMDRYSRAKDALLSGADLVLELPIPFSAASAPYFALAGVEILHMIAADTILFGSESGDIEWLWSLAEKTLSVDFTEALAKKAPEKGAAAAYYEALGAGELPSNDILALEYLRAIRRLNSKIRPIAVTRVGDGFKALHVGESRFASATALRGLIASGETQKLAEYMPTASFELLLSAIDSGEAPASSALAERAILSFLRLSDRSEFSRIAGLGGGLGNRLKDAAMRASSLDELLRMTATKKYTDGAIRRAVLAFLLGVTHNDLDAGVAYTTVLAANSVGRELLSSLRKRSLPILTKAADFEALCEKQPESAARIRRAAELAARADSLYTLCTPLVSDSGKYTRTSAFMM